MRGSEQVNRAAAVRYPRRNILAIGLLLSVTTLALIALFQLVTLGPLDSQTSSFTSMTGTPTCLPNKDTSNITSNVCALGLKGDDGRYYELIDAPDNLLRDDFSSRIKVRGILAEPDSSSQYNISGRIAVRSYTKQ